MKIIKKLINIQTKYPKKIILFFIILNIALIPGILNLINNVEPSLEKVLPQDISEIKTINQLRSEFGSDMVYILVYAKNPISDVRNPQYLKYIDQLSKKIQTREYIQKVDSLSNLVKLNNNGNIPNDFNYIKEQLDLNPFSSQYMNLDYSFSVIKVQTTTGSNSKLVNQVITQINEDISNLEKYNPGTKTQITGPSAIDRATFNTILSDFGKITLISMLIIAIVVLITFNSLSKGMLPMVIVMNALVMTMGIVGYLNLTLTVVSMVAAAMIMGLGIDFGIHQVHSFYEHRKSNNSKTALTNTVNELIIAMLGAALTTMAGFLALLFGVLPAMKTLGIILALGIFTTLIGAIFLLPPILYLYDINKTKKIK